VSLFDAQTTDDSTQGSPSDFDFAVAFILFLMGVLFTPDGNELMN
jgi:hypothetical protein